MHHTTPILFFQQILIRTRTIITFYALFLLSRSFPSDLPDFSKLYSKDTLNYYQQIYSSNIKMMFSENIIKNLSFHERNIISSISLNFPLTSIDNCPTSFYTDKNRIFLPVLSLKLLDDLSVADAYLTKYGCDLNKISLYIINLSCRSALDPYFQGKARTSPLLALGIPSYADADPWIHQTAQNIMKSAVIWIIAHELGHIVYNHPGTQLISSQESIKNEMQSDSFAMDVMRRVGIAPVGIALYLKWVTHWGSMQGDYPDINQWWAYAHNRKTHPFTFERLESIAHEIDSSTYYFSKYENDYNSSVARLQQMSKGILKIGSYLQDPELRQLERLLAMVTPFKMLSGCTQPGSNGLGQIDKYCMNKSLCGAFRGIWLSNGSKNRQLNFPSLLVVKHKGGAAAGTICLGPVTASFTGVYAGKSIDIRWNAEQSYGRGLLIHSGNGDTVTGTFGSQLSSSGMGKLFFVRVKCDD